MIITHNEIIEIITLLVSLVAFLIIFNIKSNQLPKYFVLITVFVLLSRFFTNIELFVFPYFFNILEHLSVVVVAFLFIKVAKGSNG